MKISKISCVSARQTYPRREREHCCHTCLQPAGHLRQNCWRGHWVSAVPSTRIMAAVGDEEQSACKYESGMQAEVQSGRHLCTVDGRLSLSAPSAITIIDIVEIQMRRRTLLKSKHIQIVPSYINIWVLNKSGEGSP